jgi:hypothetical protein
MLEQRTDDQGASASQIAVDDQNRTED